jgi:hypothetical protein
MGDDKVQRAWERFLNPANLRSNLIVASIFLAAFELLKQSIVERIRDFYCLGFDSGGLKIDPKYESDVLAKNRSPVYASLAWLKESGAIGDTDIAAFDAIRQTRNEIAHQITQVLTEGLKADYVARFQEMVSLLAKIEKWWIVNVEIPTNPDFDGKEIDEDGIVPGPVITLRLLLDIALGSEEESRFYFDEFVKHKSGA